MSDQNRSFRDIVHTTTPCDLQVPSTSTVSRRSSDPGQTVHTVNPSGLRTQSMPVVPLPYTDFGSLVTSDGLRLPTDLGSRWLQPADNTPDPNLKQYSNFEYRYIKSDRKITQKSELGTHDQTLYFDTPRRTTTQNDVIRVATPSSVRTRVTGEKMGHLSQREKEREIRHNGPQSAPTTSITHSQGKRKKLCRKE